MKYDITKQTAPKMPNLGKGTECIKLLLSQASKDMHEPLVPMLFPSLGAHVSGAEFQYPDNTWKEVCGLMANIVADSGDNKGQLSQIVKGAMPRFRFPSGSQCGIYNLPVLNLLKPGDRLYITEGCSDCWAMLSAGHKAVAIPSATLLTHRDAQQLSVLSSQFSIEYHMFPDRDEPGERLFLQLQKVLPSLIHHQLPPGCKDFGEYYLKSEGKKLGNSS